MRVDYQIIVDGDDITSILSKCLLSLSITDEAGLKSDKLSFEIDNHDYMIVEPKTGVTIKVALGFKETGLIEMGQYIVDEISGTEFPARLKIDATAANMRSGIRSLKTRNWDNVTLADIVAKISNEHGLKPAVGKNIKSIFFKYIAQTSESDLNFLTRIAKDLDAMAKPAGGALIFIKRGEGKTPSGEKIPVIVIEKENMKSCEWKKPGRTQFKSVVAEYTQRKTGKVGKIKMGTGEPVEVLRHRYASKQSATRAAETKLSKSKREGSSMSIDLAGFHAELVAEGRVDVRGIAPNLIGVWSIKRVEHRLQSVLKTSIELERKA